MRYDIRFKWEFLLFLFLLPACAPSIPEGKLACETDSQCPSGWVCHNELCWSSVIKDSSIESDGDVRTTTDSSGSVPVPPIYTNDASIESPTGSIILSVSAGGPATSRRFRLSLTLGAPQPSGIASSQGYRLLLGTTNR